MDIALAQREIRTTYLNGAVGSLVSAALWFASAALATWASPRAGIVAPTTCRSSRSTACAITR